jgi:hypothetical protein
VCCNCGKKEACEIADGLILCANCEKKGDWHLVEHFKTKKLRWVDLKHMSMADEVVVDI